jgi:hypothetical protein
VPAQPWAPFAGNASAVKASHGIFVFAGESKKGGIENVPVQQIWSPFHTVDAFTGMDIGDGA